MKHALQAVTLALVASLFAACQSSTTPYTPPPPPGPGVIFTYPRDGQMDIPVGARIVVTLTDAVQGSPQSACTAGPNGTINGSFCLAGPEGVIPTTVTVAGDNKNILLAQPSANLREGVRYSVFARPDLLGGATSNLSASGPLFSFQTRQQSTLAGVPPTVIAVNGDSPAVFTSANVAPKTPYVDFMSVRILFSEPINESTLIQGQTVRFVKLGAGGAGTDVAGALWVHDIHLTFDPDADLDSTATYQLQLNAGILDQGGEPLAPIQFTFHPLKGAPQGTLYNQILSVTPPGSPSGPAGATSSLNGDPVNSIDLHSQIVGNPVMAVLPGAIESQLADPSAFGGPIPLTIRKGQRMDVSPMAFQLGGVLASSYQTGTLHMYFLTDANGVIARNAYRSPDTLPDDAQAPVWVDFTFDAVMFADDAQGNAMATQTLYGVRLLGLSTAVDTSLAINNVGTIELDTLGVGKAPANVTLQLESDPNATPTSGNLPPPKVTASYPANGQPDFPVDTPLILYFSRPVDLEKASANNAFQLQDGAGNAVTCSLKAEGTAVVMTPAASLTHGGQYTVQMGSLVDLSGAAIPWVSSDATGGTGKIGFTAQPIAFASSTAPYLTALFPGAPCALEAGDAGIPGPGHCVGGQGNDVSYQPFTLSASRKVVAVFNQPMQGSSMVLGTACGQGTIRVEQVDGSGNCTQPVSGTLQVLDRRFNFLPSAPWTPGQAYRLTLVAGNGPSCPAGSLCSANGRTFNSTPLLGMTDSLTSLRGGGPPVVIDFTGAADTGGTAMLEETLPFADTNGNGILDLGETVADANRLSLVVSGADGIIDATSTLNGSPCSASSPANSACQNLHQSEPIEMLPAVQSCPVDSSGNPTSGAGPCVPIRLYPMSIQLTSLSMNVSTFKGLVKLKNLASGTLVMRLLEKNDSPAMGYLVRDPGVQTAELVATTNVYVDAPDLVLLGGLGTHNLHSYPTSVTLKGPVTFLPDGRLQVATQNLAAVPLDVTTTIPNPLGGGNLGTGTLHLTVPQGELHLTLLGEPIK
jgi:hypothetical protein